MYHIQLQEITHESLQRIALRFNKNEQLTSTLRAHFKDAQWSQTLDCWHLDCTPKTLETLLTVFTKTNNVWQKTYLFTADDKPL